MLPFFKLLHKLWLFCIRNIKNIKKKDYDTDFCNQLLNIYIKYAVIKHRKWVKFSDFLVETSLKCYPEIITQY